MSSLPLVEVVLNLSDASGNPLNRGMVTIAPSALLTSSVPSVEISQAAVGAQLVGTWPSVSLLPTDTPGVLPSGFGYNVSFVTVPGNPAGYSFFAPAGPVSFTATDASPAVFSFTPTSALTSLPNGTGIQLSGGSLPAGFVAATTYYIVGASGYTFQLAATAGGSPLGSTSSGSGSATVVSYNLSSLTPVSNVTAMASYLQLPAGTPAAGQVPVVQANGSTATEWGFTDALVLDDSTGAPWNVAVSTAGALFAYGIVQDQAGGWLEDQAGSPLEMPSDASGGGVSSVFGRTGEVTAEDGDYTVSEITGAAPLVSPAFAVSPTAPTQASNDSSTKLATTAFVATAAGAAQSNAETYASEQASAAQAAAEAASDPAGAATAAAAYFLRVFAV